MQIVKDVVGKVFKIKKFNVSPICDGDCYKCNNYCVYLGQYKDNDLYFCSTYMRFIGRWGCKSFEYQYSLSILTLDRVNDIINEAIRRSYSVPLIGQYYGPQSNYMRLKELLCKS